MKNAKMIISVLLVAILLVALSAVAYADNSKSTSTAAISPNYGDFTSTGYVFHLNGTDYNIKRGTLCSQTYNSNVYGYVYPIQFILSDYWDYFENSGYYPGPIDGLFGPQTASGVRYFQGKRGLSQDGIVGDDTWTAFVNNWCFG